MELSIIITTHNRADLLKYGLLSITKQKCINMVEVVVVNDGEKDQTEKVCDSFKHILDLKYIYSGDKNNIGWRVPGYAINIGVGHCKYKNIIISCAEMFLLDNDVLEIMIMKLNSDFGFKNMFITDGKDDDSSFLDWVINKEDDLRKTSIVTNVENLNFLYDRQVNLKTTFPFFMGLKKEIFLGIGGYDEDYIGIGYDDEDFIYRLTQIGLTHHNINRRIIHLYHPRTHTNLEDKVVKDRFLFNKYLFEHKKKMVRKKKGKLGI